jgi:hypothetical protein
LEHIGRTNIQTLRNKIIWLLDSRFFSLPSNISAKVWDRVMVLWVIIHMPICRAERKKIFGKSGLQSKGVNSVVYTMAIIESTSTSAKNVRKENSIARIVGSGSAGILELAFFHPVLLAYAMRV